MEYMLYFSIIIILWPAMFKQTQIGITLLSQFLFFPEIKYIVCVQTINIFDCIFNTGFHTQRSSTLNGLLVYSGVWKVTKAVHETLILFVDYFAVEMFKDTYSLDFSR